MAPIRSPFECLLFSWEGLAVTAFVEGMPLWVGFKVSKAHGRPSFPFLHVNQDVVTATAPVTCLAPCSLP